MGSKRLQCLPVRLVRAVESDFDSVCKNGIVNIDKVDFKRASLFVVNSNFVR